VNTQISTINATSADLINIADLHANLQDAIMQVTELVTDQHAANIMAMWRIGKILTEIDNEPENYLTDEQQANHVSPSALLFTAFNKMYTADSFNMSRRLYENYPSQPAIEQLINRRCPARPTWRVTASHVQLLLTVQDPDQRKVIEDRCVTEAYTTKALAVELNEIRGDDKKSSRGPTAPKGLKQRVYDLLEHQRKFIARSEKLWIADDGLYDKLMNTASGTITETIRAYMGEIVENFQKMQELIDTHQALCRKFEDLHADPDTELDDDDDYATETSAGTVTTSDKKKGITR
jgi:hypothetical protein